ncbi:MAG: S-layer homology domain-containing protein, partial [Alistipes sp.]|nr:S-layer homology domain-containing protein [Alistipes sp.]
MKKVIMISLFAIIFSVSSFAQNFNHKPAPKAPKVEEIAKWRAAGEPEPESNENPFADVDESEFYYKAILWAVENGITNGVTKT